MAEFGMTDDGKPLHPGRILLIQAMEPLGISRNQLARDIDVPVGRISDITNGKRGITADTALRLGRYFGTGPELWLRLQAEYDLHVARITTWPSAESRVRILESQDGQAGEVSSETPSDQPAPETDVSELENDEEGAEIYTLPGDVASDGASDVWAPAGLPDDGTEASEVASTSGAETFESTLSEDDKPDPQDQDRETGTGNPAIDSSVEEDIGIPPAPSTSTTSA